MEKIIVKREYPLLPEGVMFLTSAQEAEKEKSEREARIKEAERRKRKNVYTWRKESYPEDVKFGFKHLVDWDRDRWEYEYSDFDTFEEAAEEFIKHYDDFDTRIIAYRDELVTKVEKVFY